MPAPRNPGSRPPSPRQPDPRKPEPRRPAPRSAPKPGISTNQVLLILGVMVAGFGVFAFMMLSGGKRNADAAPPVESMPVVSSKPASAPAPIRILKELPEDVRLAVMRAAN